MRISDWSSDVCSSDLIAFLIAFPTGVLAALYLEEYAPKNRWTDLIEVSINNLAAVPSIIFGLLALAVFINWFGLCQASPLAGGLTLALMTMPVIVNASRNPKTGRADCRGRVWKYWEIAVVGGYLQKKHRDNT